MAAAAAREAELTRSPQTILVVEDEVLVRMVIADYLRGCGFHVIEAATADEAMTVLRSDEHVDLVFTDVQMPGSMDGFGLARWIRAERSGIRVIITSGIERAADKASDLCKESPLLGKPYHPQKVAEQIRALLANAEDRCDPPSE
ncbi:MAG: response regulator [Geminicoccaceae bacterium]